MIDPSTPSLRIMLVAHSAPTSATVATALAQAGHALTIVQTAPEVFKQIEAQSWDAAIIDHESVEVALNLVEQIQSRQPDLLLILLTNQPSPDLLEAGFGLGVYDWIFRPPVPALVLAAINRVSERRALHMQAQVAGSADQIERRHAINNQLAGIIGLVQLHLTDTSLAGELQQDLTLVLDHAKRLRDLLKVRR